MSQATCSRASLLKPAVGLPLREGRMAQLPPAPCTGSCPLKLGLSFQFCFLIGNP